MARLGIKFVRKEVREWVEAGRAPNFFVNPRRGKSDRLWRRVCSSRVGYTLHCLGYVVGWHTSLIFHPLNSGGLFSHLRSFFWNLWHVDIWWPLKHRIDKWRHPEEHRLRERFMLASMQAMDEGYADEEGGEKFHFISLGRRYFERVKEILDEREKKQ